jgi:hypothetical protein
MKLENVKMTVTLSEADVKKLVEEFAKEQFPGKTITNIRINVSAGYSDYREHTPASLSNITFDVVDAPIKPANDYLSGAPYYR